MFYSRIIAGPFVFTLSPRARYRAVAGEGVVIQLDRDQIIVVNELGLELLEQLKAGATIAQLATSVSANYEVTFSRASDDIAHFIAELQAQELVSQQVES